MIRKTMTKVYKLLERRLNSAEDGRETHEVGIALTIEEANQWITELPDQSDKPETIWDSRFFEEMSLYQELDNKLYFEG